MQSTIILPIRISCTVLSLIGLLSLASCAKKSKPPGVLSEEQFSGVLIEVYEAESKLMPLHIPKDSSVRLFEPFEKTMLADKKISRDDLKKTYRYYLAHPAEFEKVYEVVMDSLNLREQRALHTSKKR